MAEDLDLRREFVGIMFALAVGEIGLQAAALVQAGHHLRYLPAYSHLFLALFVIAASWVGWSRTQVPGAKKDVEELFEWPFFVLLLDTAMVVTYFVLVRTVDFSDDHRRIDSAHAVALWHVVIFFLYLLWDVITKIVMQPSPRLNLLTDSKLRPNLYRIVPTLICFGASLWMWRAFPSAKSEYLLTADFALLSMVLLFRALKGLISGIWQSDADKAKNKAPRVGYRVGWAVVLGAGVILGSLATVYSLPVPLPSWLLTEIRAEFTADELAEKPKATEPQKDAGEAPRLPALRPGQVAKD